MISNSLSQSLQDEVNDVLSFVTNSSSAVSHECLEALFQKVGCVLPSKEKHKNEILQIVAIATEQFIARTANMLRSIDEKQTHITVSDLQFALKRLGVSVHNPEYILHFESEQGGNKRHCI
eukprot:GHVL01031337.1.p1 GENE.GHVL01031337.1~~GHVL01031337.1.p1  ORF type:complete len:121 (-),score=17.93 GHVL01031337.1:342-704(-)